MTKDQHGSVIVTGGAGFIGSTLVRHLFKQTSYQIVIVDKLTYASNLTAIEECLNSDRVVLEKVDVAEKEPLQRIFSKYQPHCVFHLAAESHVDNSIASPTNFIATNIVGTYQLLEASLHFWRTLPEQKQQQFRFIHVSTDEVFGELELNQPAFDENNRYLPNSPYSASKASADHLVRAWCMMSNLLLFIFNCAKKLDAYVKGGAVHQGDER